MIYSTAETDLLPLAQFGITDGDVIYAVVHSTNNKYSSGARAREGNLDRFRDSLAWRSTNGSVAQSDRSMSAFLSSLLCFASHCKTCSRATALVEALAIMRAMLKDFPPAVLALHSLCQGLSVADSEKARP